MDDSLTNRINEARDIVKELKCKYRKQEEITDADWKKLTKSIDDVAYLLNYIKEQIG